MGRKSISEYMNRARTDEKRIKIAWRWADDWERMTLSNIKRLEMAVNSRDFDAQCIALGALKEDLLKRFSALPRVIERLSDPEDPPYVPKNQEE